MKQLLQERQCQSVKIGGPSIIIIRNNAIRDGRKFLFLRLYDLPTTTQIKDFRSVTSL